MKLQQFNTFHNGKIKYKYQELKMKTLKKKFQFDLLHEFGQFNL